MGSDPNEMVYFMDNRICFINIILISKYGANILGNAVSTVEGTNNSFIS